MYDPTVHTTTIARQLHALDFVKDKNLFDEAYRNKTIERAVSIGQGGFSPLSISTSSLRGKTIYHLDDLAELLVLRHMNGNIRRITSVRQDDRQFIVDCLHLLLSEGAPFSLFKFDIASFYESTDASSIIENLRSDVAFSGQSIRALASFFDQLKTMGTTGLPRGLLISSTLAEYLLREFDSLVSGLKGVWFYVRFVDDILIVTDPSISTPDFAQFVADSLPSGLAFNSKSKTYQFGGFVKKQPCALEHSVVYLGYEFFVSSVYRDKDNKLKRELRIDIAPSKVRRLKSRIALSVHRYNKDGKFDDLLSRFRLITGNFRYQDRKTGAYRSSGIYFNYPLIDASRSTALDELDRFVRNTINNPHPKSRLRPTLSIHQRRALCRLTFRSGYENKRFYSFKPDRLAELIGCWAYV